MWPTGLITDPVDRPDFPVGSVPFPDMPLPFAVDLDGYIMSAGTEHPAAAWRWISFLSHQAFLPSSEKDYALAVPARPTVAEASGFWDQLDPESVEALQATLSRPVNTSSAVTEIAHQFRLTGGVYRVALDELTVAEAVQTTQQGFNEWQQLLQSSSATTSDTTAPVVATPAPEVVPDNATAITFAVPTELQQSLSPLVTNFNQQSTDVVVQLSTVDTNDSTTIASTSDCFVSWVNPSAATPTHLYDLRPLLDADATVSLDEHPAVLREPFTYEGRLFGLPYRVDVPTLQYRPELFDVAGIAPPDADWSLDDFVAAARELTVPNAGQYGYMLPDTVTPDLRWMLTAADAPVVSITDGNPQFTDPAVVQSLQDYITLLRKSSPHQRLPGYSSDMPSDSAVALIADGPIAMWHDSTTRFGVVEAIDDAASAPLPGGAATRTALTRVTLGLYIAADTPHATACWQWLMHLSTQPDGRGVGYPARVSVAESEVFVQQVGTESQNVYQVYRDAWNQTASGTPVLSQDMTWDDYWLLQALDASLQGGNLEQELAEAQTVTAQY
ncbi:MAG: ABC-type glycerol-3-phosphate transport system, periplasmic component [Chloroflexi bacterium AL-W]|nr:ABC-type glycerol-3-phosphate transport system, periplasmic component [Chloroflexi bacterium AL-N1]NOK70128.1 ABC-type glycerol-3-phosphate transport system, periplasmic component [Chloroflexi bacterium AL-N10]NOK77860.1 ABC-type glycerol-3-phosphate transport system, periplasmic component [Chloroflexi bacterium AL-N5]NOK84869.1 ABC-type glycerol-3-phosphate transport system, periplasmic component [Chloroflexi bacterium AL-W]NOK91848.1 ABC-type glycerol-3-phosphate transport system, periplas